MRKEKGGGAKLSSSLNCYFARFLVYVLPFAKANYGVCRRILSHDLFRLKNKLLVYKVILKPVWAYGIQLWDTASNSNLEILERYQSKVLRIITDTPWFIPNTVIKHDLQVPTVKQETRKYSVNYWKRLDVHPNSLANALFQGQLGNRRRKRLYPGDLATNG